MKTFKSGDKVFYRGSLSQLSGKLHCVARTEPGMIADRVFLVGRGEDFTLSHFLELARRSISKIDILTQEEIDHIIKTMMDDGEEEMTNEA